MNKRIYIAILTILISLMGNKATLAQDYDVNIIYANFKKLERYIIRVEELVGNFNDRAAYSLIQEARTELEKARYLLYTSRPPRLGLAQIAMAKSKRLTDQAARLVLRKPLANLRAQLDNLITRAEQAVSNTKSDEAYYLLNQAKKFRRLSYASYLASNIVKGQEYYRISYFFAKKCLDFVQSAGRNISDQIIDLENSIRQLLSQAGELLDETTQPGLIKLLEEAETYFQEALQLVDQGKLEQALRRLQLIKRFVYRIFDQAGRADLTPTDRLENSLYSLRALLQAIQNDIEETSDGSLEKMLQNAWKLYREAEHAFQEKSYAKAQRKISLCQKFANKIIRLTREKSTADQSEIQSRIDETRRLLELQKEEVQSTQNNSLIKLHQEALKIIVRAQEKSDNGNLVPAFQLLQAATRMSSRIQRELKTESTDFEKIALENKYRRVQEMLNRLESNIEFAQQYDLILRQLRQFAEQALQYIESGSYLLAEEYLNTALEQIGQYTLKWRKPAE